jgi:transposase
MDNRRYKLGVDRGQTTFLPPRVEDYVGSENPVRAIEAYVNSLNLDQLGFKNCGNYSGVGQPPFSPATHLKLYIWGYLNRVRSSRRLEAETKRNLDLIWLLEGLTPGYHAIADFRKDNPESIKKVHREFVILCKSLNLFGGELIAIDSVYLEGNASRASVMTANKLKHLIKQIDDEMLKYHKELDRNDTIVPVPANDSIGETIEQLKKQRVALEKIQKEMEESGKKQISSTDVDARMLSKPTDKGPTVGFAVQGVVDSKSKLIVTNEVTVDTSDSEALLETIAVAKEILDVDTISVLADGGYFSNENVGECEKNGDELFVPIPDHGKQKRNAGKCVASDGIRIF